MSEERGVFWLPSLGIWKRYSGFAIMIAVGIDMFAVRLLAEGHLHILQWARSQTPPCPWNAWTCAYTAQNGRIDVLQWLRGRTPPCPWNAFVCVYAAGNGHLDVLQWLRSQTPPCPWNEDTCAVAAEYGRLDVLQWVRSQTPPCPWDIQHCLRLAGRKRDAEMEVFIRSHL